LGVLREERYDRDWYQFALSLLPSPQTESKPLLDVGAGACEFAHMARGQGYHVVGLDVSKPDMARAVILGFNAVASDANSTLPFADNVFAGAVMLDAVEHVFRAGGLISELSRIVIPNGFLLVSTPNFAWILNRLLHVLGKPPAGEGYHERFFTRCTLERLLSDNHFEVVRRNSWTYPLPPINRVNRLLGLPRTDWAIPRVCESLFAYSFVWLCRNRKEAS
jgi:SAM-dependent methyltransferase